MKKMPTPELEIIPFNTEDVIVTSAEPTYSDKFISNSGQTFVAKTSELLAGGYLDSSKNDWYSFKYDTVTNRFTQLTSWSFNPDSRLRYAWYKDSENLWYTDVLSLKYYNEYNIVLPTD